jgi:hypothetical protein
VEARQALADQSRSGVHPKQSARDRLIRLAQTHPAWALGFEDAVWWSRFAQPALHPWSEPDQPLRLVAQAVATDDPAPTALACYGLLVRLHDEDREPWEDQFLAWCGETLARLGKRALRLVWDTAGWHIRQHVRAWLREHTRRVKREGTGVRIIRCLLPSTSPWLNPIEPKWRHGKRHVVEPDGLLRAAELECRVCECFACAQEPHLAIPQEAT